jgi:hypothetical protein
VVVVGVDVDEKPIVLSSTDIVRASVVGSRNKRYDILERGDDDD